MQVKDEGMTETCALEPEVAKLMVEALNLEIASAEIDPTEPLFTDEGLGLDSIDALELALAISTRYGFQLRSDDNENHRVFANLRSLSEHIARHKTK
jgi:acyl carrier protein